MRGLHTGALLLTLVACVGSSRGAQAQEVIGPGAAAPAKPATPKVAPSKPEASKPAAKPAPSSPAPASGAVAPAPSGAPLAAPPAKPAKARPATNKPAAKKPAPKTAKKGRPPRRPSPTAPPGAPRSSPNDAARKKIAAGANSADARSAKKDPELEALRAADRVLFPKPLAGSSSAFSWDLPKPAEAPGAEVVASGLPPSVAGDPGLDDAEGQASDAEWIRSLTMPDLPVRLESRVVRYLKFYRDNPKGRAIARVWTKKSGRYTSALKAELTKAGLPTDLVWLSLIESGHNPTIVSPAGAAGLWQFMPDAGRLYGLTVDRWVDERLDPKRATEAAILYLTDLQRRFGSWELAMAAYNMGYAGLAKAIRKFNTNDYWELCRYEAGIPWETTLYVPKIFAIAVVMANKKAFGLEDVAAEAPESFDAVVVAPGVSLDRVANAAQVPLADIEALNPQLLAGRVPPGRGGLASSFRVRVPSGKAKQVSVDLAKLGEVEADLEPYVTRLGDTLGSIAAARGGDERVIAKANRLKDDEAIGSGTVLLVPKRPRSQAPPKTDEVVVISPREYRYPNRERVFYRVQAGDTLGKIAGGFGVAKSEIESWNALDPSARLQAGMMLQVWVKAGSDVSGTVAIKESQARVLVAGTPEFFDYFEGLNGKKRIVVEARAGDTLASLGRRYGMSVGWMERVNRRSRKKKLDAGDKLVVYVASGSALAKTVEPAEPEPPELPAGESGVTGAASGPAVGTPSDGDKPSAGG